MTAKANLSSDSVETPESAPEKESAPGSETGTDVFTIPRSAINYGIVAALFLLLGVIAGSLLSGGAINDERVRDIVYEEMRAAGISVAPRNVNAAEYADTDPSLGVANAPVTMIEFGDFRCGYCGRHAAQTLPRILQDYDGYVRYVFRDAPVLGDASVVAAIAGECANQQGLFWQFHDALYSNQQLIGSQFFAQTISTLGGDLNAFSACLNNQQTISDIQADLRAGQELGLRGTPFFVVGTQIVVGAQPYEVFAQVIDAELAKLGITRTAAGG